MMQSPSKRQRVGGIDFDESQALLSDGPSSLAEDMDWPIRRMTKLFSTVELGGEDRQFLTVLGGYLGVVDSVRRRVLNFV